VGRIAWESPELDDVRRRWTEQGGTEQAFRETLAKVDPVTYAATARGRRVLMINATDDEVIPKPCTLALWRAFGEPEIAWYQGGHYSVARHLLKGLSQVGRFFAESPGGDKDAGTSP